MLFEIIDFKIRRKKPHFVEYVVLIHKHFFQISPVQYIPSGNSIFYPSFSLDSLKIQQKEKYIERKKNTTWKTMEWLKRINNFYFIGDSFTWLTRLQEIAWIGRLMHSNVEQWSWRMKEEKKMRAATTTVKNSIYVKR